MSRAAKSILVFGIYMAGEGAGLLLAPAVMTRLFGLPPPLDVWVRAAGVALMVLGFYYVQAARFELRPFFGWTVPTRIFQFLAISGLVVAGLGAPPLIAASAVELAAGVWTFIALRADARAPARAGAA
jgi:hypothetical protein